MFIRYYVEIPLPFQVTERLLVESPHVWVPGIAREANARGEALLASVGFDTARRRVEKQVEVEFSPSMKLPSKTILPIRWTATGPQSLFPELDADIEIAPLGPEWSQLSISARYRPPMGTMGRAIDRALLHRVAEATIKDFLDRAADAFRDLAAPATKSEAASV